MFDTLMYTKRLEATGMTREQAEAQVQIIAEMVVDGVATKKDLDMQGVLMQKEFAEAYSATQIEFASVRSEVQIEFAAVRSEMQSEFASVRYEMRTEFADIRSEMRGGFSLVHKNSVELEHRLTVRLGGMFMAGMTLTVAILAWIK